MLRSNNIIYRKKSKSDRSQRIRIIPVKCSDAVYLQEKTMSAEKVSENGREKERKCFKDIIDLWLESNTLQHKGATLNKYKYMINKHILPALGNIPVCELEASDINDFISYKLNCGRLDKSGGLSSSYVRCMLTIITSAIKFACSEHIIKPLPLSTARLFMPRHEVNVLSEFEQKKLEAYLINNLDETGVGVFISLYAGLRIGEICALNSEDIDFENKIIHIRHTVARISDTKSSGKTEWILDTPKTKSSFRNIPISSFLFSILSSTSRTGYIVSKNNSFVSPRTFEHRFHKLLEKSGVRKINFHLLRHTFATRCIESGMDMKSLSEILGHSNVAVTMGIYVHSSMETKRKQLEKLNYSICST